MKQVQKVWAQLSSEKVELMKLPQTISSVLKDFLEVRNRFQNAAFDALNDLKNVQNDIEEQEAAVEKYEKAAKQLGVDVPRDIATAAQDLKSAKQGISKAIKKAQEASKL